METFWNRRRNRRKKGIREKEKTNERLIKDKIIRDIREHFERQEEDYYKPKRISSFWNNNYIEYKGNGNRNNDLSLDEYLNKIKPYLKDIMIDLHRSDIWKIQLTIAINFISSKDTEEEHVMHSTCDNIIFALYNDVNEDVNELLESLRSK